MGKVTMCIFIKIATKYLTHMYIGFVIIKKLSTTPTSRYVRAPVSGEGFAV